MRSTAGAALAACLALAACRTGRRPPAPVPERVPDAALEIREADPASDGADAQALLTAYPLGDALRRTDLLAVSDAWSLHLVQTRRAAAPHRRSGRRERVYVLSGSGTAMVEGRSYPAVAGTALRIEAGAVRALYPDDGTVFALLVWHEPPLREFDDDRTDAAGSAEPPGAPVTR